MVACIAQTFSLTHAADMHLHVRSQFLRKVLYALQHEENIRTGFASLPNIPKLPNETFVTVQKNNALSAGKKKHSSDTRQQQRNTAVLFHAV